ncbi:MULTISPECIES: glycosyltransferase [unclassified Cupriavidus]|jgi:rhamnosyltransferase|uniref:glycosyltransferase n=1 Tax=unclassified Cupriavidus TaxID=2640874 RepID=UPI001C00303D|nr:MULTISPECIES: glycosyltransferase [unclassified Cupriavidus]QWE93857.1 glycosyltransferase [Cupriavidus sp. EM10]
MMTAAINVSTAGEPVVAVLLATYNGLPWVEQQVESILGQRAVSVRLMVSDDMSSDGTWEWLQELAGRDDRVVPLPRGERFGGAAKNFFRLLRDADLTGVDFVALADQDDIWLPEKLGSAVRELHMRDCAAYSGNVTAFWPDGRRTLIDKAQAQRRYDFLFEAAGPGCTYVLTIDTVRKFRRFLAQHWDEINAVSLHDWMLYAWSRANGYRWYIDSHPLMEYRQHDSNQFGANQGVGALRSRLRMLKSGWYRKEIRKIAQLVSQTAGGVPASLGRSGAIPRSFLLRNFSQVRRRARDRWFFLVTVMLGIY